MQPLQKQKQPFFQCNSNSSISSTRTDKKIKNLLKRVLVPHSNTEQQHKNSFTSAPPSIGITSMTTNSTLGDFKQRITTQSAIWTVHAHSSVVLLNVLRCRLTYYFLLGTSWDQCWSMVQYSFTSTETRRIVRMDSPGRPPRLSHSFWTMHAHSPPVTFIPKVRTRDIYHIKIKTLPLHVSCECDCEPGLFVNHT